MPPKRKTGEAPVKRAKKSRSTQNAVTADKMAAHNLNVADLRALLQEALKQQGENYDPTGYAYVAVEEDTIFAPFQSQDPLAEDAPQVQQRTSQNEIEGETSGLPPKSYEVLNSLSLQPKGNKPNFTPLQSQDPLAADCSTPKVQRKTMKTGTDGDESVTRQNTSRSLQSGDQLIQSKSTHSGFLADLALPENVPKETSPSKTPQNLLSLQPKGNNPNFAPLHSKDPLAADCNTPKVQPKGNNPKFCPLRSQDPLACSTPKVQQPTTKNATDDEGSATRQNATGSLESDDRLIQSEIPHSAFLANLTLPETDPKETTPSKSPQAPEQSKLVAQQLSVAELRAMLEAALQHTEETAKIKEKVVQQPKIEDPVSSACNATLPEEQQPIKNGKIIEMDLDTSCHATTSKPVAATFGLEGEPIVIEVLNDDENVNDVPNLESQQINYENLSLCVSADRTSSVLKPVSNLDLGSSQGFSIAVYDDDDWETKYRQLEKQYNDLVAKHKKCRKNHDKLKDEKLAADDYALRVGKENMQLKDKQKIPQARFTVQDGINVTIDDLEEINTRTGSDSMFVGLLVTRLIPANKLVTMSVTGQASHRFANARNDDGTPMYPAAEGIDPNIIEFICNKVAERTAIKVGSENLATIRKRSDVTEIRKFISQKIMNLRKAAENRKTRCGVHPQGDSSRV